MEASIIVVNQLFFGMGQLECSLFVAGLCGIRDPLHFNFQGKGFKIVKRLLIVPAIRFWNYRTFKF